MSTTKPVLLTVKETCTLLRVKRPKIYELIRDGVLDGFKVGADWRIRTDSLEQLIGEIPVSFFSGSDSASDIETEDFAESTDLTEADEPENMIREANILRP